MEVIKVDEDFQIPANWQEIATDWSEGGPMSDLDRESIENAYDHGLDIVRVDFWREESRQYERVWCIRP